MCILCAFNGKQRKWNKFFSLSSIVHFQCICRGKWEFPSMFNCCYFSFFLLFWSFSKCYLTVKLWFIYNSKGHMKIYFPHTFYLWFEKKYCYFFQILFCLWKSMKINRNFATSLCSIDNSLKNMELMQSIFRVFYSK